MTRVLLYHLLSIVLNLRWHAVQNIDTAAAAAAVPVVVVLLRVCLYVCFWAGGVCFIVSLFLSVFCVCFVFVFVFLGGGLLSFFFCAFVLGACFSFVCLLVLTCLLVNCLFISLRRVVFLFVLILFVCCFIVFFCCYVVVALLGPETNFARCWDV